MTTNPAATLVSLLVDEGQRDALEAGLSGLRRIVLDAAGLDAVELLAVGALSPEDRFRPRSTGEAKTAPGAVPSIRLPTSKTGGLGDEADPAPEPGERVALADRTGVLLGELRVIETWEEPRFPDQLLLAGEVRLHRLPLHYDFIDARLSPREVRAQLGGRPALAVFAGELIDIATERALGGLRDARGDQLVVFVSAISPAPGDRHHAARVRAISRVAERLGARLVLLPALAKTAPPESCAKLSAILARAYGCARLAVTSDTAIDTIHVASVELLAALPTTRTTIAAIAADYLDHNLPVPDSLLDPEVAAIVEEAHPMRRRQGFCVWLTGLSQSGKSTIANLVAQRLLLRGRASTLLDGDVVRTHLSKGLGFSKEDRDLNIRRLGFVAAEIAKHGGVTIVAAISPYREVRRNVREQIGNFVEVFVNAPVAVCEARDQKGQYQKAREGKIHGFTGVDDPYEPPDPDTDFIECMTDRETPSTSAARIVDRIAELGFIA